ncbi:MAG: DUF4397 domain-containing protein [Actinomycetes bacterium]
MTAGNRAGQVARAATLCALLLLVLGAGAVAGGQRAAAVVVGYVRLAHLSPGTPKVDVYLTSFRGGRVATMLPGVSYGMVSPYVRVAPGTYTVSMRLAGADPNSPPVLSTNVTVAPRQAYTVAGVGAKQALALRVLHDRLAPPSPDKAAVRVVQASLKAPVVDVMTSTGMKIVTGAKFPSTTRYLQVPAQRWMVQVSKHGSTAVLASKAVVLRPGAIDTVLVLDGGKGVRLLVTTDAVGSAVMPTGGVAAGLGGAADPPTPGRSRDGLVAALLVAVAAGALSATWAARR